MFGLASCLRPALTAVGPLLPAIAITTGLDSAVLGLLGALPLLLFAAVAPVAPTLTHRFGVPVAAFGVAAALAVGVAVRSAPWAPGLWIGTALIGGAAALGNVLVPVLVRLEFPGHAALAAAAGAVTISAFAAIGSGSAVAITSWTGDWRRTLALWALPAVAVAALWAARWTVPSRSGSGPAGGRPRLPIRSPAAWAVTGYMGLQSLTFYTVITWLPTIEASRGVSAAQAAMHLLVFQLAGAPFGLVAGWLLHRTGRYALVACGASLPMLVGAIGLYSGAGPTLCWLAIAAPGTGSALTVAVLLMSHRAPSGHDVVGLSAMANSGGYALAACGPLAAGILQQWTASWAPALALLVTAAAAQVVISIPAAGRQPKNAAASS